MARPRRGQDRFVEDNQPGIYGTLLMMIVQIQVHFRGVVMHVLAHTARRAGSSDAAASTGSHTGGTAPALRSRGLQTRLDYF